MEVYFFPEVLANKRNSLSGPFNACPVSHSLLSPSAGLGPIQQLQSKDPTQSGEVSLQPMSSEEKKKNQYLLFLSAVTLLEPAVRTVPFYTDNNAWGCRDFYATRGSGRWLHLDLQHVRSLMISTYEPVPKMSLPLFSESEREEASLVEQR